MSESKPLLYKGRTLPLNDLTPENFEDFTYQCLTILGDQLGFKMQSGPQPAADHGYDCVAKVKDSGNTVCIQCKRYSSKSLSIEHVANEVIKIALDGAINGYIVERQYIITSGKVNTNLITALKQPNYGDIKSKCEEIIRTGESHAKLLKKTDELELSSITIVSEYLNKIKNLIVWSGNNFTSNLLIVRDKLSNIIEMHFAVEKVLKDSPTPNFDITKHQEELKSTGSELAELWYGQANLPNNLTSVSPIKRSENSVLSIDDIIELLVSDNNIILSSLGGSGKSSTLKILANTLIKDKFDLEYLPVFVKLRSYARGTLEKVINQSLGISYGTWSSLPFKFVFLFDGLDEMIQSDTQAFFDELSSIIGNNSFILSLRNTGVSVNTHAEKIDYCLEIKPLSYRDVVNISSKSMVESEKNEFCTLYKDKIGSVGFNFLFSPFALSLSIKYYQTHNRLPDNLNELIDNWIASKLVLDKERVKKTSLSINKLPDFIVKSAFTLFTYKAIFQKGLTSLSEADYWELLAETHNELEEKIGLVAKAVALDSFYELLEQHEIYHKDSNGFYSTPHKIISEYLASKELSKNWKKQKKNYQHSNYDIWLYCSSFIKNDERKDFLEFMLECNLSLATKIAKQYKGEYVEFIEKQLLEKEQTYEIVTRSNAVFSLGILGTEKSIIRLKSKERLFDENHQNQRMKALAINGDYETLMHILTENEDSAQMPLKISGGTYAIWFQCPPTLITEIARVRLNAWLKDKKTPICMSLRTLRIFGDNFDIPIIKLILEETLHQTEFNDATMALYSIDKECLIQSLEQLCDSLNNRSYWAKKNLTYLGYSCNIDGEFTFFIEQSQKSEDELKDEDTRYTLCEFINLIIKNQLTAEQIDLLINTYKQLSFEREFYYYSLFWQVANSVKSDKFIELVELAFLRNHADERNSAILFLSKMDVINISQELDEKINNYCENLNESYQGIRYNYINYLFKHGSKEKSENVLINEVEKKVSELTPKTITRDEYISSYISNGLLLDTLSKHIDKVTLSLETALKFLLVDSDTSDSIRLLKYKILKGLEKSTLDDYVEEINDLSVKISAVGYLLYKGLSNKPLINLEKYLPYFLSHHIYHPTLEAIYSKYWNDDIANSFLNYFTNHDWNAISAQMFEKYIDFFLNLLTRKQLDFFEKQRVNPVNIHIENIYRIWLGCHKIRFLDL